MEISTKGLIPTIPSMSDEKFQISRAKEVSPNYLGLTDYGGSLETEEKKKEPLDE